METANQASHFLAESAESSNRNETVHLVRAFEAVLNGDCYYASDAWYRWLCLNVRQFCLEANESRDGRVAELFVRSSLPRSSHEGLEDLARIARSLRNIPAALEGATLARARFSASRGDTERAREILVDFLQRPQPRHLETPLARNTLHCVDLLEQGQRLPDTLTRLVGDDNGYFKARTCPEPFHRFDLHAKGRVLMCCAHWLNRSIGNWLEDAPEKVLNSDTALAIRRSMLNGSFQFCDMEHCGDALIDNLPRVSDVELPQLKQALDTGEVRLENPDTIICAFDQSCNLSCPSCRKELVVEKGAIQSRTMQAVEDHLLPVARKAKRLDLNAAGEIFVSKPSRLILSRLNRDEFPNLEVRLMTNGTLFSPAEWAKFPRVHEMVASIRVSIDAATQETFELLRRGGDFDRLRTHLEFIADMRRRGEIPELLIAFTYQRDNFREIPEFARWGKSLGVDLICFEQLENIVFTDQEYKDRAVHHVDHPLHEEFLTLLRDPILRDPSVRIYAAPE